MNLDSRISERFSIKCKVFLKVVEVDEYYKMYILVYLFAIIYFVRAFIIVQK